MEIKNLKKKFEYNSQFVMNGFQIDDISITLMKFFSERRYDIWKSLIYEKNKGIILAGPKGIGKTINFMIMAKIIAKENNSNIYPKIVSTKEIQSNYKKMKEQGNGEEYLMSIVNTPCLIIDDLGNEDFKFNDYGTVRNIIADILSLRYILFQRGLCVTHATTNLNHKLIEESYEPRLVDRMREMFVFQVVIGGSKRENPIKAPIKTEEKVEYTPEESRLIYLEWYKNNCEELIIDMNDVMWDFFKRNNISLPMFSTEECTNLLKRKRSDFIDLSPKQEGDIEKYLRMRNYFRENEIEFNKYKIL